MSLQPQLLLRLEQMLSTVDDQHSLGPRLNGDAVRLWQRVTSFTARGLIGSQVDREGLELSCYALQLPSRQGRGVIAGKLGRTNLRERCEQAAELLVGLMSQDVEEPLLDRTTRLLQEIPHKSPVIDEAKLLADALNLEDFGVTGLIVQTIQLGLQGEGVWELSDAADKREQYGYWEARLRDGFHFQPVREIALKRLETARQVAKMLRDELEQDRT
jgi:hypothetical protein